MRVTYGAESSRSYLVVGSAYTGGSMSLRQVFKFAFECLCRRYYVYIFFIFGFIHRLLMFLKRLKITVFRRIGHPSSGKNSRYSIVSGKTRYTRSEWATIMIHSSKHCDF
jgi:hypothetical protein